MGEKPIQGFFVAFSLGRMVDLGLEADGGSKFNSVRLEEKKFRLLSKSHTSSNIWKRIENKLEADNKTAAQLF